LIGTKQKPNNDWKKSRAGINKRCLFLPKQIIVVVTGSLLDVMKYTMHDASFWYKREWKIEKIPRLSLCPNSLL